MTASRPGDQDYLDVLSMEITNSGKGAAQIYLAIDCSVSSRTTMVNMNGIEKSRLQVETEAAGRLIDTLLSSGENIYVGLVFFSGTCYRAAYLCRDSSILHNQLDEIVSNGWQTPNTDIVSALDKAKESFANKAQGSSNRYIILLSDGIPTKDDSVSVYSDEPEEDSEAKLYGPLKTSAINKIVDLKSKGIHMISILVESQETDERTYVEEIYKGRSTLYLSGKDGEELASTITEDLKKYIFDTTEVKEYESGSYIYHGDEDEGRRAEVTNNFQEFTYGNTSLFKMIDEYNGSSDDQNQAQELSDLTKMHVIGGSNYRIDPPYNGPTEEIAESTFDEETGEEIILKVIKHHTNCVYDHQDFTLARITQATLQVNMTITGLRITLVDGQTVYNERRDPTKDDSRNECILAPIDAELVHGANVEIEYTITVHNPTSIHNNYLEILAIIPDGFSYMPEQKLLSETNKSNQDYGWDNNISLVDLLEDTPQYISEDLFGAYPSSTPILARLDEKGRLGTNETCTLRFVVSQVVGSLDYLEPSPRAFAEVMKYRNNSNRRQLEIDQDNPETYNGISITKLKSVYPGNDMEIDCSSNKKQTTNDVFIIPPTGIALENRIIIVVSISVLIVSTILIVKMKFRNKH